MLPLRGTRLIAAVLVAAAALVAAMRDSGTPVARQITRAGEWFLPSWSPDGREIVAVGTLDSVDWNVYVMRSDGTGLRALAPGPSQEMHPRWSPTGDFILFDSDRDSRFHLYLIGRDGTSLRRVTTDTAQDGAAQASPDGRRIAFGSPRTGIQLLYLIGSDGKGERQLVHGTIEAFDQEWSPDGKRIAYMTGGPNTDIHILALDSAVARPLAQSTANEAGARWSPDGTRLIFTRADSTGTRLLVINSNGSSLREVTRFPGTVSWTTWCPDGKHAVLTVKQAGNEDVYAVELANARVKRLTDHPARDTAPSCAAGGRVVFASERAPRRHLFVLTIPE